MAQQFPDVRFPGWEVIRKLGEGSFGGVYEIHRTLPDGRVEKAALKKLTVPKDNSEIRELYSQSFSKENITAHYKDQMRELVNEYTLTQELNGCRNVVACHDVQCVQHTDGIGWDIYIRMELLKPLKHVLSADYQEMAVLKLGLSLCNALLACQEHHIVHRDIKPENILVSDRGEFKLGDFGIAKVSEKTATGTMTGTMGYMAPEVANRWHYGAQADIYSLGMVLYWMMNRRTLPFLPFPPTIPTAAQRQEAANRRFAGEDFPPPVNGSQELKAIVMKACAFSTEERYQTVRELSRDLYACYQQRRAGKSVDVSVPEDTDETVLTNEPTSGNTYSGNRSFRGTNQNEKTGTLKTSNSRTNDLKTGRFTAQTKAQKPEKRRGVLICVLAALCLCFAAFLGYLLVYGSHRERPAVSMPETAVSISSGTSAPTQETAPPPSTTAPIVYETQPTTPAPSASGNATNNNGTQGTKGVIIADSLNIRDAANESGWVVGSYFKGDVVTILETRDDWGRTSKGWIQMEYVNMGYANVTKSNITSITLAAGTNHTVGLCNDGTVVAAGWNGSGQCDVDSWSDIVAVAAGHAHTMGLRSDGTVVATGWNGYGQCDVDSWTDIVAVAAGAGYTIGLRRDGTVVAAGWNQSDFDSWTDIVAIATGDNHAVGLRSDGTVIATGQNDVGQCDVDSWTDIVAVAAGYAHTVGLRSDGTVVAAGRNDDGQCDVSGWKNIRLPQK